MEVEGANGIKNQEKQFIKGAEVVKEEPIRKEDDQKAGDKKSIEAAKLDKDPQKIESAKVDVEENKMETPKGDEVATKIDSENLHDDPKKTESEKKIERAMD